jgi:cell division transport system permease protein
MTVAMILTTAMDRTVRWRLAGGFDWPTTCARFISTVMRRRSTQQDISASDPTCEPAAGRCGRRLRHATTSNRWFLNREDAYNDAIRKMPQFKDLASKDVF